MDNKSKLKIEGYCKFDAIISKDWLNKINKSLPDIFIQHERIRRLNNNPISSNGLAINALIGNDLLFEFLINLINIGLIDWIEENYFEEKCILNSFTALSNISGENKIFHKKYHRDIRGFSGEIPVMLNMLVMLDDFTTENGATLLLPKSHLEKEKPSEEFFNKFAKPILGRAGDIVIWNSNLYHASGLNYTDKARRALPITFSLPYYKQLIDFPRAIGEEKYNHYDEKCRKLLGYDSRVPDSLSKWYSPVDELMYKN